VKALKIAWMLILLSLFTAAQDIKTVEIVDRSPANCPIRVSGEVQFTEKVVGGEFQVSYVDRIITTNISKKTVIAMVVLNHFASSLGRLVGENREHDSFFGHELEIAPGQKYLHDHNRLAGVFSQPISDRDEWGSPHADSEVIWVQFADSSTWGNNNYDHVQSLMRTRVNTLHTLAKLSAAANQGEAELAKALAVSSSDVHEESIIGRIRAHYKNEGPQAAIHAIRDMLQVASTR
jgi:hypothetical protein